MNSNDLPARGRGTGSHAVGGSTSSDSTPQTSTPLTRRRFLWLAAGAGVAATAGGAAWLTQSVNGADVPVVGSSASVSAVEAKRKRSGQVVTRRIVAAPAVVSLGGRSVATWGYGGQVPGAAIRAGVGDLLRVTLDNKLPEATSLHWHGLELRNDMDGAPPIAGPAVKPGTSFTYEFIVPDAGTYWFHPHAGLQLDRALYAPLIVEDPREKVDYDEEAVLVLDDWNDGMGPSPNETMAALRRAGMAGMGGMSGMDMGGMPGMDMGNGAMTSDPAKPLGSDPGDVKYAAYLINGKLPSTPDVITSRPGRRIRLRFINAGSDTAFRVAVGEHRMTVTHSDGRPVKPVTVDTFLIGMGERYDVVVTAGSGAFPILASAEGKNAQALAVLRTAGGQIPPASVRPAELTRRLLSYADLVPQEADRMATRKPDRTLRLELGADAKKYRWTLNGKTMDQTQPLPVRQGERVRLEMVNRTMMFHPMHVHGHTFAVRAPVSQGARKDTVNVLPMQTVSVDLQADNPGQWAVHCHNTYHLEAGMMTVLSYRT